MTTRTNDGAPPLRLYLDRRELTPADLGGDGLADLPHAERLLRALLVGQPPGTTGRVDALTYPTRRGSHAYAAAIRLQVDATGTPQPCAYGLACPVCEARDEA